MTSNGDNRDGAQERTVVMEVSQVEMREEIIRVQGRMDVLDTRMDGFEQRMDSFEQRMDRLEAKMDRLEAKVDRVFYAIIGFGAGIIITLAGGIVALVTSS